MIFQVILVRLRLNEATLRLMRDDLFELDAGRVLRRIDPGNEILEESAPAQNTRYSQIPRKPGHCFKLF
jgi:hypothetical protein